MTSQVGFHTHSCFCPCTSLLASSMLSVSENLHSMISLPWVMSGYFLQAAGSYCARGGGRCCDASKVNSEATRYPLTGWNLLNL